MVEKNREMMSHMCDMHKGQVMIAILKEMPLAQGDIAKIEKELAYKKESAPEMVNCNCLASDQHDC